MIEEALLNYGVLGLWTLSLLLDRYTTGKKTEQAINNNTAALGEITAVISQCKKK